VREPARVGFPARVHELNRRPQGCYCRAEVFIQQLHRAFIEHAHKRIGLRGLNYLEHPFQATADGKLRVPLGQAMRSLKANLTESLHRTSDAYAGSDLLFGAIPPRLRRRVIVIKAIAGEVGTSIRKISCHSAGIPSQPEIQFASHLSPEPIQLRHNLYV
jgi:hypothetical protein